MSRIGKHPIAVPAGVEVKVDGSTVTVKGPKGTLTKEFKPSMSIAVDGGFVTVTPCTSRSYKNTYPQHDRRRYKRLQEGA